MDIREVLLQIRQQPSDRAVQRATGMHRKTECVNKNETLNERKIELKKRLIQGAPAPSSKSRGDARLPPSPVTITQRV